MLVVVIFEDAMLKLSKEMYTSCLPINSAGLETQRFIVKKATRINIYMYFVFAITMMCGIVLLPIFGSNIEWFINDLIVEEYFDRCSKIVINFIIYSGIPFIAYTCIRFPGLMSYGILEVYVQVSLINQHILKMNDDDLRFEKMTNGEKIVYHNKIFRNLCFCIKHHVILGR